MRCQTGLMFRPVRATLLLKLLAVALFLLLSRAAEAQEKTCLEQVPGMRLESMPGKVPTYFSPGHRQRASEMKALLEEAAASYERELGVKIEVMLAAVAQAEWALLLDKHYGLPTMRTGPCQGGGGPGSSAQYVAIMPVTVGGPIYDGWVEMKGALSAGAMKRLKAAGVEFEQGGRLLLDFVALHELGHAYAHGYGLNPLSGFFAEHVTNYLTYAFMRSTKGRLDRRVMAVLTANVEGITPVHASVDRFETFRSREHPPTEAWYNSAFTLKAAQVYEARGLGFLSKVRDAFRGEKYGSITNEEILNRLEKIELGYVEWARRLPELAEKKGLRPVN